MYVLSNKYNAHGVAELKAIYYTWFLQYTSDDRTNVHWEDRRGERVRESRERKEKRQPNQTNPTLSLLRQLWSQLIFLLLLHPFGTRSFLIFFRYINDLDYCVMTQRDRLNMAKMRGGRCF